MYLFLSIVSKLAEKRNTNTKLVVQVVCVQRYLICFKFSITIIKYVFATTPLLIKEERKKKKSLN